MCLRQEEVRLPRILVSHGRLTESPPGEALGDPYLAALTACGAVFQLAPAELGPREAEALTASAAGLLLCGGVDVDPRSYGHQRRPWCGSVDPCRDEREKALIDAALSRGLPLLAICRGIQMLNVALGGTLYQDILTEVPGALSHTYMPDTDKSLPVHLVDVVTDSALAGVLGCVRPAVNSRHHQALRDVAPTLAVVARAPDGVVEAVELPACRFAFGVQWHPEDMVAGQAHAERLFRAFVAAALPGGASE